MDATATALEDVPRNKATKPFKIRQIRIDLLTRINVRESLNEAAIEDYAAKIRAGVKLPPAVVFMDVPNDIRYLGAGNHRCEAYLREGHTSMECEIRFGTRRDARLFAIRDNLNHGVRYTRKDREFHIKDLLRDEPHLADNAIGKMCDVDHGTVAKYRSELEATCEIPKLSSREGADGKTRRLPISKPRVEKPAAEPILDRPECPHPADPDFKADDLSSLGDSDEAVHSAPEVPASTCGHAIIEHTSTTPPSGPLDARLSNEPAVDASNSPTREKAAQELTADEPSGKPPGESITDSVSVDATELVLERPEPLADRAGDEAEVQKQPPLELLQEALATLADFDERVRALGSVSSSEGSKAWTSLQAHARGARGVLMAWLHEFEPREG